MKDFQRYSVKYIQYTKKPVLSVYERRGSCYRGKKENAMIRDMTTSHEVRDGHWALSVTRCQSLPAPWGCSFEIQSIVDQSSRLENKKLVVRVLFGTRSFNPIFPATVYS